MPAPPEELQSSTAWSSPLSLFLLVLLVLHHVDQDAVGVRQPVLTHRAAAREQLVERLAFLASMDRRRRRARIVARNALDVGLERIDALDLEADVIHAGGDDAGAVIVGDVPR